MKKHGKLLMFLGLVFSSFALMVGAIGFSAASEIMTETVATDPTSTLTFASACGGSGTADDGAVWTVTSDAAESTYDGTKGIHYGTGSTFVSYLNLTTSDIPGTISTVVVNASGASSTSAKLNVSIGGSAFDSQKSLTSSDAQYSFNGSSRGTIVVSLTQSSAKKALYVKSIKVTYEADKVSYLANGATSGTAPTDSTSYTSGQTVTVKGNTGSLAKTGFTFDGWNTKSDGTGTSYAAGATFSYSSPVVLFAKWLCNTVVTLSESSITVGHEATSTFTLSVTGGTQNKAKFTTSVADFVDLSVGGSAIVFGTTEVASGSTITIAPHTGVTSGSVTITATGTDLGNPTATVAVTVVFSPANSLATTYTFSSKSWAASPANWTSVVEGYAFVTGKGVQVTEDASGAGANSPVSFTEVTGVQVRYSTSAKGAGSVSVTIGTNSEISLDVTKTDDATLDFDSIPKQTGTLLLTTTCSKSSIYIRSITIWCYAGDTHSISVDEAGPVDLVVGNTKDITPTVTVTGIYVSTTATITTSDSDVVSISDSSVSSGTAVTLTAESVGVATITFADAYGSSVSVTVNAIARAIISGGLAVSEQTTVYSPGDHFIADGTLTVTYNDDTQEEYSIATLYSSGDVTFKISGTAITESYVFSSTGSVSITLYYSGKSRSFSVSVAVMDWQFLTPCTSTSDLVDGDRYVIAVTDDSGSSRTTKLMPTSLAKKHSGVSYVNSWIDNIDDEDVETMWADLNVYGWTVGVSGSVLTFENDDGKFLTSSSDKAEFLTGNTDGTKNSAKWTMSVESGGWFNLVNVAATTRQVLYQSAGNYFAPYATSNLDGGGYSRVKIYKAADLDKQDSSGWDLADAISICFDDLSCTGTGSYSIAGTLADDWDELGLIFLDELTPMQKAYFLHGAYSVSGEGLETEVSARYGTDSDLALALSRYDFIIHKYDNLDDYIGRKGTSFDHYALGVVVPPSQNVPQDQSPLTVTLWVVLGSGLAGLTAIGAAYWISKKRRMTAE